MSNMSSRDKDSTNAEIGLAETPLLQLSPRYLELNMLCACLRWKYRIYSGDR